MVMSLTLAILGLAGGTRVHTHQRVRVRGGVAASLVFMSDAEVVASAPAPSPPPPVVKLPPVSEGQNAAGLKTITLTHPNGDSTRMYPFGACVTSYICDGVETLKVRPDAKMDGSKPISGGIPFCFPQFGPGAIQQHGFARNLVWEVVSTSPVPEPTVLFRLVDSAETRAMWDYAFEAHYTVTLAKDRLKTSFKVLNTGNDAFSFTAALHSYFDISSIANLKIKGNFKGATYLDKMTTPPQEVVATSDEIIISKETDCVYKGVSGEVKLIDSGKGTTLAVQCKQGWRDTVIWNPYGNTDMGFDNFVCAEAALASFPFTLKPGVEWTGVMDLILSKN